MSDWLNDLLRNRDKPRQATMFNGTGVEMIDSHAGRLRSRGIEAEVRLEPGDWIRVSSPLNDPPQAIEAMQINHTLPGSLRFAQTNGALELTADTQLDGQAHLVGTFKELKGGLAWPKKGRAGKQDSIEEDRIEAVLQKLGWDLDRIVRLDHDWELRPRIHGEPIPVRLQPAGSHVRLYRVVLANLKPESRQTVAEEALRLNGQLRFARYAYVEEQLVAEVFLHAGIIDPRWIAAAAHAVAIAGRHASRLRLLIENEQLRRWYGRVFEPGD